MIALIGCKVDASATAVSPTTNRSSAALDADVVAGGAGGGGGGGGRGVRPEHLSVERRQMVVSGRRLMVSSHEMSQLFSFPLIRFLPHLISVRRGR